MFIPIPSSRVRVLSCNFQVLNHAHIIYLKCIYMHSNVILITDPQKYPHYIPIKLVPHPQWVLRVAHPSYLLPGLCHWTPVSCATSLASLLRCVHLLRPKSYLVFTQKKTGDWWILLILNNYLNWLIAPNNYIQIWYDTVGCEFPCRWFETIEMIQMWFSRAAIIVLLGRLHLVTLVRYATSPSLTSLGSTSLAFTRFMDRSSSSEITSSCSCKLPGPSNTGK